MKTPQSGLRERVRIPGYAHGGVFRRPGPQAADGRKTRAQDFGILEPGIALVGHAPGDGRHGASTHPRHADGGNLGPSQHFRARERTIAKAFANRSRQDRRARHAHLLPDDRPHGPFERVPNAGHADPRSSRYSWRQIGVLREVCVYGDRVRIEIEQAAQPGQHRGGVSRHVRRQRYLQTVVGQFRLHASLRGQVTPITPALDGLNAIDGSTRQEPHHPSRVVRLAERQLEAELGRRRREVGIGLVPDGRRRLAKGRPKRRVESPNAAEAGQHRNVGAGKIRLLDKPPSRLKPSPARERRRRDAQLGDEQPGQLADSHADRRRQLALRARVQETGFDKRQRAQHSVARGRPRRRRSRRPTTAARSKSPGQGNGWGDEITGVVGVRQPSRANRSAKHACRHDAHHEAAVEARIARHVGAAAGLGVRHHAADYGTGLSPRLAGFGHAFDKAVRPSTGGPG